MYIQCMLTEKRLTREQRRFFALVARAGFSCPFGEERLQIDRRIADVGNRYAGPALLERVTVRVRKELSLLEAGSRFDLRRFCQRDRQILRVGLLFDLYHRFLPQLDEHILEQLAAGDDPVPVPFSNELLTKFADCGFAKAESLRYLAFFFQLRRAFYFIAEGLVGCSPSMVQLRRHLWNNIFTADIRWYEQFLWNQMEDFSTLLLGDTGCGKGAAAAAIGRSGYIPFDEKRGRFSESFARNFLAINLSQFPENLIESELFGHRKGAFTGAVEQHQGFLPAVQRMARFFLMRSGMFRFRCRSSYCRCCKSVLLHQLGLIIGRGSPGALLQQPIGHWMICVNKGFSATIFTTGSARTSSVSRP